ncbi:MAG TPA: hypothetical protein VF670_09120 [Duganella sp.]|jgi:hypothetical protein
MKLSYVGAIAALSAAALLTACGGKAQYSVQGPVINLTTPGLTLSNGGETISVPAGATSYTFSRQIDYGTSYEVKIVKDPEHMTCGFNGANPTGSAGHTVSISVPIVCSRNTYLVGGRFTGLPVLKPADGTVAAVPRTLTLLNGTAGGTVVLTSPADNTGAADFAFGIRVADGQSYGVTIDPTTVPADRICTVKNGTGFVTTSDITNIAVDCVPK